MSEIAWFRQSPENAIIVSLGDQSLAIPDGIEFLTPWRIIEDSREIEDRAGRLSERQQSEVPERHVLHGLKARAIATRIDRDDVLFEIEGGTCGLRLST